MSARPWRLAGAGLLAAGAVSALAARRRAARRRVASEHDPEPVWRAEHAARVQRVAHALRTRSPDAGPISLRKRAVSHQVPRPLDGRARDRKLDVAELDRILCVDPQRRVCVAEPGVTFEDLVAATRRYGLAPLVVPELKTITIGGAVAGCSIESSSFRTGGFHDTCLEYEVLTAGGELLTCTRENEHQLVFGMVHGTFGTVGVLTQLTFRLAPAAPFVHVVYERHARLEDYLAAIQRHRRRPELDFMDGLIHSPREHVLCLGRYVDQAPYTHRYDWTRVYYRSTLTRAEDYLRCADYFFRYDHGVTNVFPRTFLGRLLLGPWTGSTQLLRLAERLRWLLPRQRPTVTVDLFLPLSRVTAFLGWYERAVGHYPLWVVPYARVEDYPWIADELLRGVEDDLFLDLAVYGLAQGEGPDVYRLLEGALLELGGLKTLISHNHFTEDEFWRLWNRPNYEAVKAATDPQGLFRDLYTKTCRTVMGRV